MICRKRRKEGVCPRKRARNPPSQPPKSRKTPARKTSAAKTASKAATPQRHDIGQKAGRQGASKPAASSQSTAKRPSETGQVGRKHVSQSIAQADIETVNKIQSIGSGQTGSGTELAEGAKAPAFRLPRDGGDTVSLADYAGKKLVLFFYPRADTPGCTREAIDFTRLNGAFADERTAVLGVSADTVKAQEAFRRQAPAFGSSDLG